MAVMTHAQASTTAASSGGRMVAADGRELPFVGAEIEARASGGVAEVVLRHRFINDGEAPLQATYQTPLPDRAAVGGYAFTIGDRRVVGEIDTRESARERYEEALLEGKSAALLDQERTSLFTQVIGNVPPGTEVICELRIDQPLDWADGAWEWRFPTVVAPRYAGASGRTPDAGTVHVDVLSGESRACASLRLDIGDAQGEPTSPSHAICCDTRDGSRLVQLCEENGVRLDRDVVVRWRGAAPEAKVRLETARSRADRASGVSAYGLLTLTPPSSRTRAVARDLILLIDTSASMDGEPLRRALELARGVVESLGEDDRLEMVAFSTEATRWQDEPVAGTIETKRSAIQWLGRLQASGGTEMQTGLKAALRPARAGAQRQVILLTDGYVGFEREMVRLVRSSRPAGVRVHTVGVGSATNRTLTGMLARAGGGAEFQVALDEDAAPAIARLVARTSAPLIVDVRVSGDALETPVELPDLMAGAPSLAALALRPGGGTLTVTGRTPEGEWLEGVDVEPIKPGAGRGLVPRMYAREEVDRLEIAERAAGESDAEIEQIGLVFGISTRRTSWIAVSEEPTVDPTQPTKRVRIPQELSYGLSAEGLGLEKSVGYSVSCVSLYMPVFKRKAVCDMVPANLLSRPTAEPDRAIIVTFRDGRLVVSFEAETDLDWDPKRILLNDLHELTLDTQRSTGPGRIVRGQTIRLVLTGVPGSLTRQDLRTLTFLNDPNSASGLTIKISTTDE